jgi:hypothetical protein
VTDNIMPEILLQAAIDACQDRAERVAELLSSLDSEDLSDGIRAGLETAVDEFTSAGAWLHRAASFGLVAGIPPATHIEHDDTSPRKAMATLRPVDAHTALHEITGRPMPDDQCPQCQGLQDIATVILGCGELVTVAVWTPPEELGLSGRYVVLAGGVATESVMTGDTARVLAEGLLTAADLSDDRSS